MKMKTNNKTLTYKGYFGSVEYDLESKMLYGQLLGIKGAYIYEGHTLEELEADFKQFVDDYLYDCEQEGTKPQRPFSGTLNVRLDSELHKMATLQAKNRGQSLNGFIRQAIEHELHDRL
jgi:predicted HicB family RNase H-like nuclease